MRSKRSHEGYLLVDHRNSPGLPDDIALAAGLPQGAGKGIFEGAIITCSHCQTGIVLEPRRTRERAYCSKCDHYICDTCGAIKAQTGECKTFNQIADEAQEQAARGSIILLT